VTGTSMANLVAVWVARARAFGFSVRQDGLQAQSKKLVAYTSVAAHACVSQAMDLSGLGSNQLRIIPVLEDHSIDCQRLQQVIQEDRLAGLVPFFVAGTAGTVDVGAIDDLPSLADIAQQEQLWFHIDGAYGALAMLSPEIAPRLSGIERADSIAFDFHKWAQVPYDAGYILIRDGQAHYDTFASDVGYLRREQRGLAAGSLWPCDYGPDLSRGFRALKTWFTIQVYGADRLGEVILQTCQLAQYLKEKILATSQLELLAPVSLNIVCFRYRCEDSDSINAELAVALQESGIVAPSTNIIRQQLALRAAIVNHRTTAADIDALIDATLRLGAQLLQEKNISQN
jgi:glutamate/tyrosine decarboxylase-like PLP-dependent enzyme